MNVKPTTPLFRLIDGKIEGGLDNFVAKLRTDGATWPEVVEAIREATGESVTRETLRPWYADRLTERRHVEVAS